MDKKIESCYVPFDVENSVNQHGEIVQSGIYCGIEHLRDRFAWMKGHVNAFYGWSNDGKGTFTDNLMVKCSKVNGWKWLLYKQEDMDAIVNEKKEVEIKANKIYKNLAWTLTGKTWHAGFASKYRVEAMTLKEELQVMDYIVNHFYVMYPQNRLFDSLLDHTAFMIDKYKIDGVLWDPWNTVKLKDGRTDQVLSDSFIDIKELALRKNVCFNIINHPRSMNDVRDNPKDPASPFKVVNQYMQLGGSAWDMKMDAQFSIHRTHRHLKLSDPRMDFWNLKQRDAEIVGVERGQTVDIEFDKIKRQYYFGGVNPMDGSVLPGRQNPFQGTVNFSEPKEKKDDNNDVPF